MISNPSTCSALISSRVTQSTRSDSIRPDEDSVSSKGVCSDLQLGQVFDPTQHGQAV